MLFDDQYMETKQSLTRQILELQADIAGNLGAKVETIILEGQAEREILRFAQAQNVDLIVLGTSRRMLMGRGFLWTPCGRHFS